MSSVVAGPAELLVGPALWVDEQPHVWLAVNFRLADDVRAAGVDPNALGAWIVDSTPGLVSAVECGRGTPLRRRPLEYGGAPCRRRANTRTPAGPYESRAEHVAAPRAL
jgi:hypothetical protein